MNRADGTTVRWMRDDEDVVFVCRDDLVDWLQRWGHMDLALMVLGAATGAHPPALDP